jgi:hypothetical protein
VGRTLRCPRCGKRTYPDDVHTCAVPPAPVDRSTLCVMCGTDGTTRPDGSPWGAGAFTGTYKFHGGRMCWPCSVEFRKLPQIERERIVEAVRTSLTSYVSPETPQ